MIPVKITDEMFLKARQKNSEMGLLRNSIIKGNGSIAGFIGEQIVLQVLGGEWTNTYEYDIVLENGLKVEVKTKQTTVEPKPDYSCSISNFNTHQQCDIYAFTRVMKDYSMGWYLGYCTPKEYFEKASFVKKGTSTRLTIGHHTLTATIFRYRSYEMFKTLVVICSLQVPDLCLTFEDTIRLREDREECKVRAVEMIQGILSVRVPIPPPYSLHYKCEEAGEIT